MWIIYACTVSTRVHFGKNLNLLDRYSQRTKETRELKTILDGVTDTKCSLLTN